MIPRTRRWWSLPGSLGVLALLGALTLIPWTARAGSQPGAGVSLGIGLVGYAPAPVFGPRVRLPSLEVAFPSPGPAQLRLRVPVLDLVYHAALRHQFDLDLDLFLLWHPEPTVALAAGASAGPHVRGVLGPMVGLRVNAAPNVFQPGVAAGGRFGIEILAPQRRGGMFVVGEPLLEFQGGSAGGGRTAASFGGGVFLTIGFTRYKAP